MKRRRKIAKILILALLLEFFMRVTYGISPEPAYAATTLNVDSYDDGKAHRGEQFSADKYIAQRIDYAFSLYGPGTFFSKNGRACTCHPNHPEIRCLENNLTDPRCNCLRYVDI
ncbi:MAG: hypothetical protein IJS80_01660 [Lachnospiraceae bacterium]|nr:hypothetical protein [Lachnospiraceae bacterium]